MCFQCPVKSTQLLLCPSKAPWRPFPDVGAFMHRAASSIRHRVLKLIQSGRECCTEQAWLNRSLSRGNAHYRPLTQRWKMLFSVQHLSLLVLLLSWRTKVCIASTATSFQPGVLCTTLPAGYLLLPSLSQRLHWAELSGIMTYLLASRLRSLPALFPQVGQS